MKLIFTFSIPQEFNPFMNPYEGSTTTLLELPDEAAQLPDAYERVLSIANAVGSLTRANLSVTCLPLGIKDLIIKDIDLEKPDEKTRGEVASLLVNYMETVILFNYRRHETTTRQLRIAGPIPSPLPKIQKRYLTKGGHIALDKKPLSLAKSLYSPDLTKLDRYQPLEQAYFSHLIPLVDNLVILLNTNPHLNDWQFQGICPLWYNESQHKQAIKRL
jgi:hypothetical protein